MTLEFPLTASAPQVANSQNMKKKRSLDLVGSRITSLIPRAYVKRFAIETDWQLGELIGSVLRRVKRFFSGVGKRLKNLYKKTVIFARRHPLTSFFVALFLLFLIMYANVVLAPKPQEVERETPVKDVEVYRIGKAARTNIMAQVEKEGVINIVAISPGIVSEIHGKEGQHVAKGTTLVQISSNYQGENAANVAVGIASKQYQLSKETFDIQMELIAKQREVAEKTDTNADDLRRIAAQAASDAGAILMLNDSVLNTIDNNLHQLETDNNGGVNDEAILQTRQLKSQLMSANSQVRQGLSTFQSQASSDGSQARLSDLQKEIALRQLDLQEKSLAINTEVAQLQVASAAIAANMLRPVAPFSATIVKVHVQKGDAVNPGVPLMTIAADVQEVTLIARVPAKIAQSVSQIEESVLNIGQTQVTTRPIYISQEATDGQFYSLLFSVPTAYYARLTDGAYVRVEVPIGTPSTGASIPFIPIDSVYQTQDAAFVYVVADNTVVSKTVVLGEVIGSEVEIVSGLAAGDQVIVNRNVIAGDKVKIIN